MTPRTQTKRIMYHCTATYEGNDYDKDWLWDLHVVQNGWSSYGYHWWIHPDGTYEELRDERMQGAGCSGQNHDTIHVAYIGGLEAGTGRSKDTRTPQQIESMIKLTREIAARWPDIDEAKDLVGHNQFAAKDCPCFNVPEWVQSVIDDAETGNPEPGDPEFENMIQHLRDQDARINELERVVADLVRWKNDD